MTRFCHIILAMLCISQLANSEPNPSSADVEKKFFTCWLVTETIRDGKSVTDPEHLNGQQFDRNECWLWSRRGELNKFKSLPPKIDATTKPMRVDFPSISPAKTGREKQTLVMPCIFKFEGDKLVIAYGKDWVKAKVLKDKDDYEGRPTEFKSTKDNGVTIEIMKPCAFYDQD